MCRSKGLMAAVTLGLALFLDAAAASAQRMYWTDRGTQRIQSARLDGGDVRSLIVNVVGRPASLALDVAGGRIYWFDAGRSMIQRSRVDGSNVEDLVPATVTSAFPAPVLDLGHGRMYWAQGGGILRARLNGSEVESLVTGQFGPTGLALDLAAGKMYWNDSDRIQRANLDGTGLELLVATGAPLFNQSTVTLDLAGGKMYWMTSPVIYEPARIQRANLDGSQVEDLLVGANARAAPPVLDVAAGKMYWSDDIHPWGVRRANLDGSSVEDLVVTPFGPPTELTLDTAGKKMYWAINSPPIKIQRANLDGSSLEDIAATDSIAPGGLRLNPGDGKLYWAEFNGQRIQRADFDGSNREDVVSAVVRTPGQITVDVAESRIFWADVGRVYRARLDGSSVEAIVSTGSTFAGGVALDPIEGKLYWSVLATDAYPGGLIRRGNRDGSGAEDVVSTRFGTVGIALDPSARKVYWTEVLAGQVRRANLDGSNVQDLVSGTGAQGPPALDPVAGHLYWQGRVGGAVIYRAGLDGSRAEPLLPNASGGGLWFDRGAHQIYWTSNSSPLAIMRAGLAGQETLLQEGLGDLRGIALDVPLTPMAGTGLVRSASASGFDSFAHVFEALPGATAVGPIGSTRGALKDVDVDPTTGLIYTIDFLPGTLGQQVYVIDPVTGVGAPLPYPTGLAAPALIWGLAFDAGGALYGGGLGVYAIDKTTGRAASLADITRVPALILGMSGSRTGAGFISTGLLLAPGPSRPYVAEHGPDGAFVADRVLPLVGPQGQPRLLVDIGLSESGFLYGNAWRCGLLAGTGGSPVRATAETLRHALTVARASTRDALEAEAKRTIARILEAQAAPEARSDLVVVHLAVLEQELVATMTTGAPLEALLLGLGRTIPDSTLR